MNRFFKEIEFETESFPNDAIQKNSPKVIWDKDKLKAVFLEINNEISKIKNGTSEYTTYAVNPGSFGFPAENSVKIFIDGPSDKTFEGIQAICRQDFGAKAGDHFYRLLKSARREEIVSD